MGWKDKTGKIPNPLKRDDTKSSPKKIVAQMWPKNLMLNVKDHIASTSTRHGRKPIPCAGS
jgi:hypothetical protein